MIFATNVLDAVEIDPTVNLTEHERDELHVFQSTRRYRCYAEEVLELGAMRKRRPVFPLRSSREAMLERLAKLGIPAWRITGNGKRLDERSDQYLAERLAMSEDTW